MNDHCNKKKKKKKNPCMFYIINKLKIKIIQSVMFWNSLKACLTHRQSLTYSVVWPTPGFLCCFRYFINVNFYSFILYRPPIVFNIYMWTNFSLPIKQIDNSTFIFTYQKFLLHKDIHTIPFIQLTLHFRIRDTESIYFNF